MWTKGNFHELVPDSGNSRDIQSGSCPGSGWDTQGHSQSQSYSCFVLAVCFSESWNSFPQSEDTKTLEQVFPLRIPL